MKKFILFIIFSVFISVSGVNAADLVIAFPANAGPLNPHMYSPNQMYAQALVYDPLVRYGEKGVIEPAIAESWMVSKDGTSYTFNIRRNAKFSDGSPINAYAVVKNFDTVMGNKARHEWVGIVGKIKSYKATDENTFVLNLTSAYPATLEELSLPRPFRILAPSGFDTPDTSKGIKKPIGSGAWILAESKLGEYDIFVRNDNYWGIKPTFDRVVVKVLPDPNARVLSLETGAVDMLIGEGVISLENFARLSKNNKFVTKASSPQMTNFLVINASKDRITQDKNIRLAILHSVNKDIIMKGVLLNIEHKADYLFNQSLKYCNINIEPYNFDIKKAEQILDNAGWIKKGNIRRKDGKPLELTLLYIGTDPKSKAIGEVIQGDLAKIGVTLRLKAQEEVSFYQAQKTGAFDIIFESTWGTPFDPHSFLSSMRASSHADYAAQKDLEEKPLIDKTINNILSTNNEFELVKYYDQVLKMLHESGVYLPISYGVNTAVYNKSKITGFEFGQMNTEFMFHKLKPVEVK